MKKMMKIFKNEHTISFRTVSNDGRSFRRRSTSSNFYITYNELNRLKKDKEILAKDIYSFANIYVWHDRLQFEIYWLDSNGTAVKGEIETIEIDYGKFISFLDSDKGSICLLEMNKPTNPKIEVYGNNIKSAVSDPKIRKKLAHAFGKNFNYVGYERIVFSDDYNPNSFFFREYRKNGAPGLCGGLIYHKRETPDKSYYAVHT